MSEGLLVFQHLPKTAGTTWRALAYRQVPDNSVCPVYEDPYYCSMAEFAALPEARKRAFRLLIGHFGVEIERLLPDGMELRFGTFLRRPLERCLSHINHLANSQRKDAPPSLGQLFDERYQQIDNLQVRMLSGRAAEFGKVDEAMLEEACARLDRMAFVGLTHRFAESYALAMASLGWKPLPYRDRNLTEDKEIDVTAGFGPAEHERLMELNRFDARLVERAEQVFQSRVQAEAGRSAGNWQQRVAEARRCGEQCTADTPQASEGGIDSYAAGEVRGWARLVQYDQPAIVAVEVDGVPVARARAVEPHPAKAAEGVSPAGRCGFTLQFPVPPGEAGRATRVRVWVMQTLQVLTLAVGHSRAESAA